MKADQTCMWCRRDPATTLVFSVPTCEQCSSGGRQTRVSRWLSATMSKGAR